ncbi:autophagy-related protein 16-like [Myxocyprinus asiaticus]|uniref:autophagy-related protein 16-like n=1 Tax=Myxocyprinus asiaticus TaxID=70543 RepID=UPI002222340C|nr:autophagy-related protein 16-like [Myxocyprinus asiaticus]
MSLHNQRYSGIRKKDAHELSIKFNAVRFSTRSNLLATGGTDRVIKLWDIEAGTLQNRGTLDGSNEASPALSLTL